MKQISEVKAMRASNHAGIRVKRIINETKSPLFGRCLALLLLVLSHGIVECADAPLAFPSSALAHAQDYAFGYYPQGWRGRNAAGDVVFAVETSEYALLVNPSRARIERLGPIADTDSTSTEEAVARNKEFLLALPPVSLQFSAEVDGQLCIADQAAPKPDAVVLQRMGRYLQHFEIHGVTFRKSDGALLEGITAQLNFYCWSDRLSVTLAVSATQPIKNIVLKATLALPNGFENIKGLASGSDAIVAQSQSHSGFGLLNLPSGSQTLAASDPHTLLWKTSPTDLEPNSTKTLSAIITPSNQASVQGEREHRALSDTSASPSITAQGVAPYTDALAVTNDPVKGWTQIMLGSNPDIWTPERVRIKVSNPSDLPQTLRLNFAKEGGSFGITGMSPVLRDTRGLPMGLPVQISKNWHCRPGWFSGLTMIELDPHADLEFEFMLAYAQWGGVPAVSHAQLCLDGYGGNQQWDQMALGSFGESICYDPDVNLTRSMVDDMRPLMVWGMGDKENTQWSWTHNVGGADFLVLFTGTAAKPIKQYLTSQKTHYASQGPVIADVTYAGEALDGAIQSRIRARTWRTDDYVRALYSIRYDVQREVRDVQRLAFFQLAADRYNENIFEKITRGDLAGEKESWTPETGGERYSRRGEELAGAQPWFAFYKAQKPTYVKPDDKGAWANRGLIVRNWTARLGGNDCPNPFFSVYGTGNGPMASSLVELSPPSDLATLNPGDFVEAEVEMLILPQHAEDYYGPNTSLIAALRDHPDDWQLVHREAVGLHLAVLSESGTVEAAWPIRIRAKDGRHARFTIQGGIGYVPLTISGASKPGPFKLVVIEKEKETKIDQSALGNDWWQSDYDTKSQSWNLTFTLPVETLPADGGKLRIEWRLVE